MAEIFVLITQLRNSTNRRVGFRVDDGYYPTLLRDLAPGKTRNLNPSRILRCCRQRGSPDWKIRVLIDDLFTGIELDPLDLLNHTRIEFRYQTRNDDVGGAVDVLCVQGIPESCSDYFLRLKYFGWMRNFIWDNRASIEIAREDPRVAKKLRDIEGGAPFFAEKTSLERQLCTSPMKKADDKHEKEGKRDGPITIVPLDKSKGKTLPPPPPPPPPPPSQSPLTRDAFRDFLIDETDGSSTDTSDHESSTSTSDIGEDAVSGTHAQRRVASTNDRRINGGRGQWADSSERYMDTFDYFVLFIFAFTLAWCLTRLFAL